MYVKRFGDRDAPSLVLLHAIRSAHDMWESLATRLAGLFQVLVPDLPGYGHSPGPFTFEAATDALGELAGEQGGDGPIHLCGVSLGARVALKFAAERPERVASLFLSGCGVRVRAPRRLRAERLAMRALPERFFTHDSLGAGKAATIESSLALAGLDLSGHLGGVTARTLVVCGAKDKKHLPDAHEIREGIPGAELRVIPGAGHFWNRERPELFTRTLLEWTLDRPVTEERAH
jgi:3-oxoadipate enol-lactonase